MKRIILTIITLVLLTGCTDPVKEDLSNYISNEIQKTNTLEKEIIDEYEKNINTEYFSQALNDVVIPKYTEFLSLLKSIKPKTEEIIELHDLYVKGAKKQLEAFEVIKTGLESKDNNIIESGNKLLNESEKYMSDYKKILLNLVNKHNIKYKS